MGNQHSHQNVNTLTENALEGYGLSAHT
uniref:Uncharacterized protein n=1 Tax=mine drainage metagenome TaxID=410659 RepID=E6QHT6_9ZZZZ